MFGFNLAQQQQQQQQAGQINPSGNLFGSTQFGSTTGFGNTAPQQQMNATGSQFFPAGQSNIRPVTGFGSQPQSGFPSTNSSFSTAPTTAFGLGPTSTTGGFGVQANNQNTSFAPQQILQSGQQNPFGANTTGTQIMGAQGGMGSTPNSFLGGQLGNYSNNNSFNSGQFGLTSSNSIQPISQASYSTNQGTGSPPYEPTVGVISDVVVSLVSISAMPQYQNFSLEELRIQDYAMGKKHPGIGMGPGASSSFQAPVFNTSKMQQNQGFFPQGNTSLTQPQQQTSFPAFAINNTTTTTTNSGPFSLTNSFQQPSTGPFATAATTNQNQFAVANSGQSNGFQSLSSFGTQKPTGTGFNQTGVLSQQQNQPNNAFNFSTTNTGSNIFGNSTATQPFSQQQQKPNFNSGFSTFPTTTGQNTSMNSLTNTGIGQPTSSIFGQTGASNLTTQQQAPSFGFTGAGASTQPFQTNSLGGFTTQGGNSLGLNSGFMNQQQPSGMTQNPSSAFGQLLGKPNTPGSSLFNSSLTANTSVPGQPAMNLTGGFPSTTSSVGTGGFNSFSAAPNTMFNQPGSLFSKPSGFLSSATNSTPITSSLMNGNTMSTAPSMFGSSLFAPTASSAPTAGSFMNPSGMLGSAPTAQIAAQLDSKPWGSKPLFDEIPEAIIKKVDSRNPIAPAQSNGRINEKIPDLSSSLLRASPMSLTRTKLKLAGFHETSSNPSMPSGSIYGTGVVLGRNRSILFDSPSTTTSISSAARMSSPLVSNNSTMFFSSHDSNGAGAALPLGAYMSSKSNVKRLFIPPGDDIKNHFQKETNTNNYVADRERKTSLEVGVEYKESCKKESPENKIANKSNISQEEDNSIKSFKGEKTILRNSGSSLRYDENLQENQLDTPSRPQKEEKPQIKSQDRLKSESPPNNNSSFYNNSGVNRVIKFENHQEESFAPFLVSPTLEQLKRMTKLEISRVKDLTITHPQHGSVKFLGNVDLSSIDITRLCIDFVKIEPYNVNFYACLTRQIEESTLNSNRKSIEKIENKEKSNKSLTTIDNYSIKPHIPALVKLRNMWPVGRNSMEPIKNPAPEIMKKYVELLKKAKGTEFRGYDPKTGEWEFVVPDAI